MHHPAAITVRHMPDPTWVTHRRGTASAIDICDDVASAQPIAAALPPDDRPAPPVGNTTNHAPQFGGVCDRCGRPYFQADFPRRSLCQRCTLASPTPSERGRLGALPDLPRCPGGPIPSAVGELPRHVPVPGTRTASR